MAYYRPFAIWMLTRAGDLETARHLVTEFELPEMYSQLARGYLALTKGRPSEAASLLQKGFHFNLPDYAFASVQALATALEQSGQTA